MLLLTGCGKEMAESEEPSVESTDESIEQTVSVNIEETETADISEETPGRFQYDEKLLYLEQPVVTEEEALAEGKTLLILQTSLPNTWLKNVIAGFNRQSENYFIRREEANEAGDEEYFPSFQALRMGDAVYGMRCDLVPDGISIRKSVLGDEEQPDIETLVEKLYTSRIRKRYGGTVPVLRGFWNICYLARRICGG